MVVNPHTRLYSFTDGRESRVLPDVETVGGGDIGFEAGGTELLGVLGFT